VLQLDNFRKLIGYNWIGFNQKRAFKQDKGQSECTRSFVQAIMNGDEMPISIDEIFEVTEVAIDIALQLRE